MLNLDERYHSYLDGSKKLRIDGEEEKVIAYGWHCQEFVRKKSLRELQTIS